MASTYKCVVFTAESSYARFRKPYTTTSALTFSCIHPVAAKGLIGAIMGVEYQALQEYTKNMKIAIQVINPIYKDIQSFNLIAQSNNNGAANFQSRVEFLRDVKYRIFVIDTEEKLESISTNIKNHRYIFTPYLGCSEHIAKLKLEAYCKAQSTNDINVDSVIPSELLDIDKLGNATLYMDRLPLKINNDRVYTEYIKVAFSNTSLTLKEQTEKLYKVGDYNVIFL